MVVLALFLNACTVSPSTPTSNPVNVQDTAIAAAFTIVAETHAAMPTNTIPPPTGTGTPTISPTDTPAPSPTVDLTAVSPTTVAASGATADPCNQPIKSWSGPSANFSIDPEYSPQGKDDKVVLSLWVMTPMGECGFLSDISYGPVGQYSAAAYVDGKKDFKVFGGFRITEGSWKIVIRNDSIIALGSCYPNC